jgi:8-oxo-dGTP diphosphatase
MYQYKHPHPAVTTDIVIFTIDQQQLKLLLIRRKDEPYKDCWALPGGFVNIDEGLEICALRELQEETGVIAVYLEQLYTFGKPDRDPRERVISVAYYALAPINYLQIRAASDAKEVAWFSRGSLPLLAFDHDEIVSMAHERLVSRLNYSTIALQFMPKKFTLSELQTVHEIIQGEAVDKRNFRKRILACKCIKETGGARRYGNHRPARLYTHISPGTIEHIK